MVRNTIVVAHPDDESIWFSSILALPNTRLVWCYAGRGHDYQARALPVLELLSDHVEVQWLKLRRSPRTRQPRQVIDEERRAELLGRLSELSLGSHVYSHAPWGEYGHYEHLAVHDCLVDLGVEVRFPIRFDRNVRKTRPDRCSEEVRTSEVRSGDLDLAERLRRTYVRQGIWTGRELSANAVETFGTVVPKFK